MATIVNARDTLLQAAGTRVETVSVPSNWQVPNAQVLGLGALALLNSVAAGNVSGLGALATQNSVNLATQVTGALASGNVSGLGALALLNTVNLATQTTGTINANTQVTNLGSLAFASSVAANQIGAGTLAAGVVYAGNISANNITSGTLTSAAVNLGSGAFQVTTGGAVTSSNFFGYNSQFGNLNNPNAPCVLATAYSLTAAAAIRAVAANGQNAIEAIGPAYVSGNLTVGGSIVGTVSNASNAGYATSAGSASTATTATSVHNTGGNATVKNSNNYTFTVQTDGNLVYYNSGGGVIWQSGTSASDRRLKDAIVPTAHNGLDTINALEVVDFQWTESAPLYDGGKRHTGFIAQQVNQVIPDVVRVTADTYLIQKDEIIPFLVKAVQELFVLVKTGADEINALKTRVA